MANVWTTKGGSDAIHEVDPISRIEGHLGVKVTVDPTTHRITDANAHGNLWRGFENFLLGRDINDAITFVQRICGVCPVPHGMTSTYAVDTVLGYSEGHITFSAATSSGYGVPPKAVLIRNLVQGAEFLMSSITHFYHLAALSYVQGPQVPPWTPYFDNSYYSPFLSNGGYLGTTGTILPKAPGASGMTTWDAVILSYVKALKIRRMTLEAGALFAGRMPMTSCFVGGGVTNDHTEDLTARIAKFKTIMITVANFVVQEYIPIALALGVLYQEFDSQTMNIVVGSAPNTITSGTASKANHRGTGGGIGRFLAWGGFPGLDDSLFVPGGVFEASGSMAASAGYAGTETLFNFRVKNKADVKSKFITTGGALDLSVPTNLTEDITNSRYGVSTLDTVAYSTSGGSFSSSGAAYPGSVARTKPVRANGYTYIKAPRWAGKACEVGPFARMVVAGLYPVDGTAIAGKIPLYVPVYTNDANTILDQHVIGSDIWNGLANDGILGVVNDWVLSLKGGLSTMDRLRARALESLYICIAILGAPSKALVTGAISWPGATGWLHDLGNATGDTYRLRSTTVNQYTAAQQLAVHQGWGGNEAPRGALMHQATIKGNKIQKYQCIVPTTWNGSPKSNHTGDRGAMEEAMIGAPFSAAGASYVPAAGGSPVATAGGTEVLRIAQSFDPCIACAIH
jgi:hydrogenase large subunit